MSDKIQENSLSGILGVLIATSGLVGSAFSRDPIYAICSFVLASIVIVWMNIGRKRLDRSIPQPPIAPERDIKEHWAVLEGHRAGLESERAALEAWVLMEPTTPHSNTRILETRSKSNLTASSESASSAKTKLVDAPA